MDCQQINRILDNHQAAGLTSARRYEVTAHLSRCEPCANAWQAQEALLGDVPAAPGAALYQTILSRLAADTGRRAREDRQLLRRFGPIIGLAAAASLALALVIAVQGPSGVPLSTDPAVDGSEQADVIEQPSATGSPRAGELADTPVPEPRLPAYQVGIHYTALPDPVEPGITAGRVEVCEFFMFSCVHCYNLEESLAAWHDSRADRVELVRIPVIWNDLSRIHAQAYYAAVALGREDELMLPFFRAFHDDGNSLATTEEIRRLFVANGVSPAQFDATFASSSVRRDVAVAVELNRRYSVNSTPSLSVNGQFVTDVGMAGGSYEELFGVIDDLVARVIDEEVCSDESCPHITTMEALNQIITGANETDESSGIGRAPAGVEGAPNPRNGRVPDLDQDGVSAPINGPSMFD